MLGCNRASYYEDPSHSIVSNLYQGDVSISKTISSSTNEGNRSTLHVKIDNSEVINQPNYNLKYAGSLIPLLTYRNLSKEGINEVTHIEVTLTQRNDGTESTHTFEYKLEDLENTSKCFDSLAIYLTNEPIMLSENLVQYFDLNRFEKTKLVSILEKLKNTTSNINGLSTTKIIGFDIIELETGEKGIRLAANRQYNGGNSEAYYLYSYDSIDKKIIGFKL